MMATVTRTASLSEVLVLAFLCTSCGGDDESAEARLRAWVDAVHAAARDKDRGAIIERISPAYIDSRGNTRDDINNILRLYFLRADRVAFIPAIDEIDVFGETAAEISLAVAMAATNQGVRGLRADAYRFELELEARDGDWLLISARWAELGQTPR